MTANLEAKKALKAKAYALVGGYLTEEASKFRALKFSTDMLEADIENGGYGLLTHPAQAKELLKLDTEDRRKRAWDEASTLVNIMGGNQSGALYNAVKALKRLIEAGTEEEALYGEKFARDAIEAERELRRVTGDPSAIHYPAGLRKV